MKPTIRFPQITICAAALGMLGFSVQAQTLTKCTDANGAVSYQEGSCKGSAREADVRITAPGIGGGLTNSEKAAAESAKANAARANVNASTSANSNSANRNSKSVDSNSDSTTAIGSNSSGNPTRTQGLSPITVASIENCPNVEEEKPPLEELKKTNPEAAAKKNTDALCKAALAQRKAKAPSGNSVYLVK